MKLKFQGTINASSKEEIKDESYKEQDNSTLNGAFFESFQVLASNEKKMLFITAGKDSGAEAFRAYFKEKYLHSESIYLNSVETYIIENANHIYTLSEWQEDLINKISDYVKGRI